MPCASVSEHMCLQARRNKADSTVPVQQQPQPPQEPLLPKPCPTQADQRTLDCMIIQDSSDMLPPSMQQVQADLERQHITAEPRAQPAMSASAPMQAEQSSLDSEFQLVQPRRGGRRSDPGALAWHSSILQASAATPTCF